MNEHTATTYVTGQVSLSDFNALRERVAALALTRVWAD